MKLPTKDTRMKAYLVVKDVFRTRMMQAFDVFAKNKFVGKILEATLADTMTQAAPAEILKNVKVGDSKEFEFVGVIVPGVGSEFLDGHEIYSTGTQFSHIDRLKEVYG